MRARVTGQGWDRNLMTNFLRQLQLLYMEVEHLGALVSYLRGQVGAPEGVQEGPRKVEAPVDDSGDAEFLAAYV